MPIVLEGAAGTSTGVQLELDPVSEDAQNVQLELVAGNGYSLTALELPAPERERVFAASADTEGDPYVTGRFRNREITVKVRATGTSHAVLEGRIFDLQEKLAKIGREGGTLKVTTSAGTVIVFDLLDGDVDVPLDWQYALARNVEVTLKFIARPFGRGAEVDLGDNAETSLPVLVFTDTAVGGDVPALGRLVIDEDDGDDQWSVLWGVQSRYYSADASAALFYEAETRLPMGGGTLLAVSGASGGTVVHHNALASSYQAVLSTASSGTAHLSHVGDYRVYGRVQTPAANAGTVSMALEWAEGDFRQFTQNPATAFPVDSYDGSWRIVDFGQVHLTEVTAGAQRWEGRVLAKSSTAGDDLYVDWLMLCPAERMGVASGVVQIPSPTVFAAQDGFDHAAGSLHGKVAPTGGAWTTSGDDPDDFTMDTTGHTVQRATTLDSGLRYAISGMTATAGQVMQVDVLQTGWGETAYDPGPTQSLLGAVARWTDASNHLAVSLTNQRALTVKKIVAGVETLLFAVERWLTPGIWQTMWVAVETNGRWTVRVSDGAAHSGQDTALATGGALASGGVGFRDGHTGASATTRKFDNFAAWLPPADAAIFASQSLEVRADRVTREDSTGALWTPPSKYEGTYLTLPPAGRESRTVRTIVKASRGTFDGSLPDSGIDDISARLYATPRYLVIPG